MSRKIIEVTTPNPNTLRDEWFVAPILPGTKAPREWYSSEKKALEKAAKYSIEYETSYEVYKRTHLISVRKA